VIDTNKKYLILGILFSAVLLLSSCQQEAVGRRIIKVDQFFCVDKVDGNYCSNSENGVVKCYDENVASAVGCASTQTCENGKCVFGTQTVPTVPANVCSGKSDGNYCKDENTRVECYDENEVNPQNCGTGQKCSNGKCVEQTCTDNDGGEVYWIKGTTKTQEVTLIDQCQNNTLIEYYCGRQTLLSLNVYCIYGCKDGVCLNPLDCSEIKVQQECLNSELSCYWDNNNCLPT